MELGIPRRNPANADSSASAGRRGWKSFGFSDKWWRPRPESNRGTRICSPIGPNYRDEDATSVEILVESLSEITTFLDSININERLILTEGSSQSLIFTACLCARIVSSIAYKNFLTDRVPSSQRPGSRTLLVVRSNSTSRDTAREKLVCGTVTPIKRTWRCEMPGRLTA